MCTILTAGVLSARALTCRIIGIVTDHPKAQDNGPPVQCSPTGNSAFRLHFMHASAGVGTCIVGREFRRDHDHDQEDIR